MAIVEKTTKLQKTYIEVLGLCCASEVPLVESILNSLPGIKDHKVIVPTRTVIVVHDSLIVSQLQIVKALNQARLEANVRLNGSTNFEKKWPSPYATVSGVLLALSFLKYAYSSFRWVALGAVAVGIFPMLLKAYASAKNLRLDANILMLIAAIGTVTLGDYTEAGTIVFLFCIAEWLESRAGHKAQAVMSSLMSIAPQKAVIAETGEEVDVDEVKLNTVLVVKAGEVIPIDAIVVDGMCEVDEKSLTGESYPVTKEKDSTVWAGTINLNGYVTVKTTALAEDCVVAKMTKLVEEAQNSKSATQRFIDKCAMYYTPAVIVLSGGLAVVPLALRLHNRSHWFHLALVVLVSACPCALILSTPVATFCALTKAATAGLLIKGGDYLETLAKIKVIAFDKTGTLTRGEFVVNDFVSLSHDISSDALLYWASSIESKSSHPMATAIVDYARTCSVEAQPENVDEFQNYPGEGIHGRIDGHNVYIGNKRIAVRAGSETIPSIDARMAKGKTIGFIYVQGRAVGVFSLSDVCRTGVKEALNKLISLNIKSVMLTGDSQSAAVHTQEELGHGLNAVHSELLPEDKAAIIESLKKEGPTAMVGDGINDAPALATADIGISMGISGSALATETGQVILMSNDLQKVPTVIKLARKAHRKVIENVFISITAKAGILALAIAGHPLVWAAVLADVGTCILVIMNSMLLFQGTENHDDKCCKLSDVLRGHKDSNNEPSENRKNCCAEKKVANVPVRNSCCKSGSCSKNSDKQQQYQTEVDGSDKGVSNELEASNLKHHEDVPVVSSCWKSKSCRKNDLLDSTKKHQVQNAVCKSDKEKPCHDGSFQKDKDDLEASIPKQNDQVPVGTSCCKSKTCKKSDNSDTNRKQVFNGSFQMIDRDLEANNPEDVRVGTPCCKLKSCTKNELSNTAKSLPDPDQLTVDIHPSPNSGMKHACWSPGKREMGTPCCKSKSCTKNELSNTAKSLPDPDQINVDIHPSPNSGMKHACSSPGKREMEGCCKSYMKECCIKHVHLTNCGIVGGLTEIVRVDYRAM